MAEGLAQMDKDEFLKIAPSYYSTAIIAGLLARQSPATQDELSSSYGGQLSLPKLFEISTSWLKQHGIIDTIYDPFWPPIIVLTPEFNEIVQKLREDTTFPLHKYLLLSSGYQRDNWLNFTLRQLNDTYSSLNITPEDLNEPPDKEWEPIPLERDNPQLINVIKTVDDVVEKVRSDNGYTAHLARREGLCTGQAFHTF